MKTKLQSFLRGVTAAVVLGVSSLAPFGSAQAAAVDTDTWYTFGFGGAGSDLVAGAPGFTLFTNPSSIAAPAGPWTFSLASAGQLFVTDGFLSGDRFEIFNFGTSLGLTSAPTRGSDCGADLTCALNDPNFSSGSFMLAAGSYSITGIVTDSPFGGGAGGFIVRSNVPEPSTVALLGLVLTGLALSRRRRPNA